MEAQNRFDEEEIGLVLVRIMKVSENRKNPVYLTALAHHQVNMGQYIQASKNIGKAKFNWKKTPATIKDTLYSELVEIEAAAAIGEFYRRPKDNQKRIAAKSLLEKALDHASRTGDKPMLKRTEQHLKNIEQLSE